ncbi:toprim domain-containing protein [Methylibium sp.]|uniref:DUF7146 domain-containing protein n=1 Tax=Methylibium sp. TaxID=2067992 RepID=UPI001835482E|nr:toprim domain-containing protein [Methylibium sp.]MBA3590632.1 toprim domain-containing protein [Methylibium sp.]
MRESLQDFGEAIRAALGNSPNTIEPGRLHRFPTNGRRGDTSGWCKLFPDARGGVFGCHRQGMNETWTAADPQRMSLAERAALARHIEAATRERAAVQRDAWVIQARRIGELWGQCVPLTEGDPAALYLTRRGFPELQALPTCVRLHRSLTYWHEGRELGCLPAMVAPLTAPDDRTVALHRTYLTPEGRKADVPTVKKLTAASGPLAGASVRLYSPRRGTIGVCEGIETALAASMGSGVPTVAAYCANGVASYFWPAGVQSLVIFADADKAGREAADKLRVRALSAGLRVNLMIPTEAGTDWCDVWAQRSAVEIEGDAA